MISIKEIAEYLELTIWDWMAVLIALLSFGIACLSLNYAIKTLKSQRQTEINTLPVINIEIQEFLFKNLITRLFEGHLRTTAIWNLLSNKSYKYYISERFFNLIKIPEDIIHIELFYINYDQFRTVQGLIDLITDYNNSIDVISCHTKNPNISNEVLYLEIRNLLVCNDRIASHWKKVMNILWGYNTKEYSSIFLEYIEDVPDFEEELKLTYYKSEEVYSDFFELEKDKKRMLKYMDDRTKTLISTLEFNLIERK